MEETRPHTETDCLSLSFNSHSIIRDGPDTYYRPQEAAEGRTAHSNGWNGVKLFPLFFF